MPVTIDGTSGITTPTYNGADTSEYIVPVTAFKNRIINGDMRIDQRNAGASVTPASGTLTYTLDRFFFYVNQASKLTTQQNAGSVTPPAGFRNYLGVTSSSSYSSLSTDEFILAQRIEGFNAADLAWGTASASSVTLSFWVRSSLTGTFGGAIQNSAQNRIYVFSYTISAANTWEQKSITIPGDTTGTWLTTNGNGLQIDFDLGTGSTYRGAAGSWGTTFYNGVTGGQSVVGTNGATFYITGVQLEKGSTATSFDYRPYGTELALCQRYFAQLTSLSGTYVGFGSGNITGAALADCYIKYPTSMRTNPTLVCSNTGILTGGLIKSTTTIGAGYYGGDSMLVSMTISTGTIGYAAVLIGNNNSSAYISLNAEL